MMFKGFSQSNCRIEVELKLHQRADEKLLDDLQNRGKKNLSSSFDRLG